MRYHLAIFNIARLRYEMGHPNVREFVDAIARVNALAEESPGFVWRLRDEPGDCAAAHPWSHDPLLLPNLSVWEDAASLRQYVYRSEHLNFYLRREEWFEKPTEAHYVLWWVPEGHIPTLEEAHERLEHYRKNGPSERAFWFGKIQPAPGAATEAR
jgi:hypothetical protein